MLVISILLTIALPSLPRLGRSDLEASAERLASTMTYLADEASLRGRIYRLTLDLDAERWDVAALAPFAAQDPALEAMEFHVDPDDEMAQAIVLPAGVELDAVLDRGGETAAGERALFFLPEGVAESVRVRFEEEGGANVVVAFDAALGSAYVEEVEDEGL
jgi:hypothetical protein